MNTSTVTPALQNPPTITSMASTFNAGGINSVMETNGALGVNLQSPWNSVSLSLLYFSLNLKFSFININVLMEFGIWI